MELHRPTLRKPFLPHADPQRFCLLNVLGTYRQFPYMNTCQIKPFSLNIGGTYLISLLTFPYTSGLNPNQLLKPDPLRLSYRSKHPSNTAANPSLPLPPNPLHSHHPVGFCTARVSNNLSLGRRPRSLQQ